MQTIAKYAKALQNKEISAVELTKHYLKRINEQNAHINAYVTVTDELALAQAKAADEKIAQGGAHPLCGVPIAHKDIFCTKGVRTACGSKMLDNFISPYDAYVIEQCQDAGLVSLGKTNMDEFAMGSSNETSYYGAVKNPWNHDCIPGGSSGGSAAAVAADLCPGATGTDTGGSIRQPASLCGITGIKPTYGRISRYGMIAFASSLDQAGPMAKNAEDCAHLLNVFAGHDPRDSTCVNKAVPDYTQHLSDALKGKTIGLAKPFFSDGVDARVCDVINQAIKTYESLGANVVEVDLPHNDLAISAYYIIAPAEASSNLSRFDGVRYGYRCDKPQDLNDLYMRTRTEGFGDEVKRRILIGTYALCSGYYDAYYLKAQKIRRLIANDFAKAFEHCDYIAGPTSPTTAFKIGDKCEDPVAMYQSDANTLALNLAGLPGMSIPAGFVDGMPVGLQLIGKAFDESGLLNMAHQFQLNSDFHLQSPAGV